MTEFMDLFPEPKPIRGGRLKTPDEFRPQLKGRRFIFTVAQNNTTLHDKFWETLLHMKKRLGAKLYVGKLSYNKNGWQRVTKDSAEVGDGEPLWYDPRLTEYFLTEQVKVADGLVFCGELDILPTAAWPFRGLDNYSGMNSAIIPHTKMQMKSLATMKYEDPKFLYSTGAVTVRNYIQRKAGQIAEYHHVHGALYVEVAEDGAWFARPLNADDDGVVYDLDRVYGPGWSKSASKLGRPIINLGDVHVEKSDKDQTTGAMDMMFSLNPEAVFVHDLIDFKSRNHHNLNDPHFLFKQGFDTVENDVLKAALWLKTMTDAFPDTHFYVIKSNHDEALDRWVRDGSGFKDVLNAKYWHYLNYELYSSIEKGFDIDLFEFACLKHIPELFKRKITWVRADQSVRYHDIEFGMHGHYGPNGSRGSPTNLRQIGLRANTGHTHSAGIIDGVWTSGVLGSLDMGYNRGPSSWSCSHIVTYPNGKRTIVTQRGKRWRA